MTVDKTRMEEQTLEQKQTSGNAQTLTQPQAAADDRALLDKYERLKEYLRGLGSVVVAFSAGVDSTFLLYAAHEALPEHVMAVTACCDWVPGREQKEAEVCCERWGVRHEELSFVQEQIPEFGSNPPNRCYYCKKALFSAFRELADRQGFQCVAEGTNLDDEGDFRPGMQAIRELGIVSPLKENGFTKQEIRSLSRMFGLPTWNKPSFACLASRVPYGEEITPQKLSMVEQAEALLLELGFTQFRVRIHGTMARIELLPEEFDRFMQEAVRTQVYERFLKYGFSYVSLDIRGYRMGSLNETLRETT